MKPNELNSGNGGAPQSKQWPSSDIPSDKSETTQKAAAQVLRAQIDNIFDSENSAKKVTTVEDPQIDKNGEDINPYHKTHDNHTEPQADQWQQYHSAWQDYYKKYYEGYYGHYLKKLSSESKSNEQEVPDKDEILFDLRQKLIGKVNDSATKVKKSRHFKPIAAGVIVVLIFALLQYNRVIIANVVAYVSPGTIDPQNIIIDPSTDVVVGPEPLLIIPKINVSVPVHYDIGSDYDSQMAAMANGVAHFSIPGASSRPGQVGNTVISGHSSNGLLDAGDYKFIFAQLDKLVPGDTIHANYLSKRYTYTVIKKEIVQPDDVSKLIYETNKPILTLITCTPLGTAKNRLLVTAEQISPDPSKATTAPVDSTSSASKAMPGNSQTWLEKLFGINRY